MAEYMRDKSSAPGNVVYNRFQDIYKYNFLARSGMNLEKILLRGMTILKH